nr:hypothetical protein [Tanacetum cinerariifolium]
MIAYLTKSDASEGFNQIIDFLNGSSIRKQVGDLSSHTTKYSSPTLTQKVFANMRRVGKGISGVETPLFKGMIVEQPVGEGTDEVHDEGVPAVGIATEGYVSVVDDVVPTAGRMIADMDADVDVILEDAKEVAVEKSANVDESADVQGRKANATITAAAPQLTTADAPTLTTAPSAARRRKGVVIRDLEEFATPSIIVLKPNLRIRKEDNAVKRYQALKRKPQTEAQARKNVMIYLMNVVGFKMEYFKGMTYDDIHDIYTKATPLARKVPVVDYEIYNKKNKSYYKFKRADGSLQLYLSFLSMLRNIDREDMEVLWQLVKERFASTKPKNFSNDFLLITLGAMFDKPDVQAQI